MNTNEGTDSAKIAHQRGTILAALAQGASRTEACKTAGVPRRTFYNWLGRDPGMCDLVADAERQAVDTYEDLAYHCIRQAATDPRYLRALFFYLERKAGWVKPPVSSPTLNPNVPEASMAPAAGKPAEAVPCVPSPSAAPSDLRATTTRSPELAAPGAHSAIRDPQSAMPRVLAERVPFVPSAATPPPHHLTTISPEPATHNPKPGTEKPSVAFKKALRPRAPQLAVPA